MIRARLGGLSILWQTLLLLLAALIASQLVTIVMFVVLDPPRPDFNRLSDIAQALTGRVERDGRERALIVRQTPATPTIDDAMTSDPRFTALLAERVGVRPDRVLLFFEPDQRRWRGHRGRGDDGLVPIRRGEPLFFNTVVAGVKQGTGWRVVETPPPPLLAAWQRRMILWFAASVLVLLPLAWLFARALTRPISRFADAAGRMGADPLAPRVREEGPAELRVTARALNRMQERLSDYLAERTAMIGAIAHDLRTPLARIAFRIEAAPEDVRDKVQQDIEQMRAMISATIGFVRGGTQAAARTDVPLAALLDRMVADAQEMARPVTLGAVESVTLVADPVALERLFQNLIDNGIAYGGGVEVSVRREPGAAVACFSDRGPGLSPEQIERVFHPFERGDPSRSRTTGGIGLGLTIARSIAHEHGGSLDLLPRDGGGLIALCRFPLR